MGRITQWRVGFDDQRALKKKETGRGSLRGSAHCCPRAQWRIMSRDAVASGDGRRKEMSGHRIKRSWVLVEIRWVVVVCGTRRWK